MTLLAFLMCVAGLAVGYFLGTCSLFGIFPLPPFPFLHLKKDKIYPNSPIDQPPLPCVAVPDLPQNPSLVPHDHHLLETSSLLIWAKNSRHTLIYKNKTYESFENHIALQERLGAPVFPVTQENTLIDKAQTTGDACKNRLVRSAGGQTFTFDAWSTKDSAGNTWIFAYDLSAYEREQTAVKKSFRQFEGTFEHFPMGIAIWGKNQRLKKFNNRFAHFFQLDVKWLARHPSLEEVLELLRQKRMLPEVIDFAAYKRKFQAFFQGARRPLEEMVHLPDERSFRFLATSYLDGGLLWTFEDLTEPLTLKRINNAIVSVSEAVSNHMREGICILGVDRRIILINPVFKEWWGLDKPGLETKSFSEVLDGCRPYFYYRHAFPTYKTHLITCLLKRSPHKELIYKQDGLLLEFEYVPLPNGDHMLKFTDVTESHRTREAFHEARRLLSVDQYLFLRRTQQLKVGVLQDASSNDLSPPSMRTNGLQPSASPLHSAPHLATHSAGGKILEQLRHMALSLGEDRPMVRERLSLAALWEELQELFTPLIVEKGLTVSFINVDKRPIVSNKHLFFRFLSRLIGFGLQDAAPHSHAMCSMTVKGDRIVVSFSFKIQKTRCHTLKSWYHPWDLGFALLKEMASLSGCILSVSTSHPGRLRFLCVFTDHLRFSDMTETVNKPNPAYKSAVKTWDTACG